MPLHVGVIPIFSVMGIVLHKELRFANSLPAVWDIEVTRQTIARELMARVNRRHHGAWPSE